MKSLLIGIVFLVFSNIVNANITIEKAKACSGENGEYRVSYSLKCTEIVGQNQNISVEQIKHCMSEYSSGETSCLRLMSSYNIPLDKAKACSGENGEYRVSYSLKCTKIVGQNQNISVEQIKHCMSEYSSGETSCLRLMSSYNIPLDKAKACSGENERYRVSYSLKCTEIVGQNQNISVEQIKHCMSEYSSGETSCLRLMSSYNIPLDKAKACSGENERYRVSYSLKCTEIVGQNQNISVEQIKHCMSTYSSGETSCLNNFVRNIKPVYNNMHIANPTLRIDEQASKIPTVIGPIEEKFQETPKLTIDEQVSKVPAEIAIPENNKSNINPLIKVEVGGSSMALSSDFNKDASELVNNIADVVSNYSSRPITLNIVITCIDSTDFISPNSEPRSVLKYSIGTDIINNNIEKYSNIKLPFNHRGGLIFDIWEDDIIFNDKIGICSISSDVLSKVLNGKSSASCSVKDGNKEICSVKITKI